MDIRVFIHCSVPLELLIHFTPKNLNMFQPSIWRLVLRLSQFGHLRICLCWRKTESIFLELSLREATLLPVPFSPHTSHQVRIRFLHLNKWAQALQKISGRSAQMKIKCRFCQRSTHTQISLALNTREWDGENPSGLQFKNWQTRTRRDIPRSRKKYVPIMISHQGTWIIGVVCFPRFML